MWVDVEIGYVGRYFRPPLDQVGFYPLNDFLKRDGWLDRLLPNRLATWSKDGVIFGVPQDIHPVVLVYNDEIYKAAGVDLATSRTWDEFIQNSLKFQAYWREQGRPRVWSLEVTDSNASTLVTLLLQRGVNIIDEHQQLHFTNPKTLDTLMTVCQMLAGPKRIGASTSASNEAFAQDLGSGYVNALLCPDWRLKYLKDNAPSGFAGKMRVMPLPAWPDSPYRTSTAGGSMVGIPRNARDPEKAWKMIQALYLSDDATTTRSGATYVLPPVKTAWANPAYDTPDPYFSGQPVKRILADLATNVPPRYVTPASTAAEVELANVLIRALRIAATADEATLRERCRELLTEAETRVKRQIAHGSFEE